MVFKNLSDIWNYKSMLHIYAPLSRKQSYVMCTYKSKVSPDQKQYCTVGRIISTNRLCVQRNLPTFTFVILNFRFHSSLVPVETL